MNRVRFGLLVGITSGGLGFCIGLNLSRFSARESQIVAGLHLDSRIVPASSPASVSNTPSGRGSLKSSLPPKETNQSGDDVKQRILESEKSKLSAIRVRAHGFEMESDKKEIANVKRETLEQLRAVLSPKEFQDYQVDQFKETEFGRSLVLNFSATEGELAAIADYTRAQERFEGEGRKEGVQERNNAILEASIGSERFAEFMNFKDPDYQEVVAFVNRFGFDRGAADQVIALRNEAMRTNYQLNNPQGDPAEMSALRDKADRFKDRLAGILGKDGAANYIHDAKLASWIR